MRALRFDGALHLADVPVPQGREGEALVRVRMAGICHTDLELMRGYKGFAGTLGHEFVGEVIDGGLPAARVCGEINLTCGACPECLAGRATHCRRRTVLGILGHDGAFADYLTLPRRNLHPVPDTVSDAEAVFVEPLAAAFQILEQVPLDSQDRVTVLGDGKLGLLCAQVLAGSGARVEVIGKHAEKLQVAREFGLEARLRTEPPEDQSDVVIEATGSTSGLQDALALVRPRGTIVLKSTIAVPYEVDLSPAVVKEVTMQGSRCGPFPRALTALQLGEVQVRPLIEACYRLDEGLLAMQHAARPGAGKILINVLGGNDVDAQ